MNSVLDNTLVGLALLVSAGYAVTSLGPRSLRRRLLASLSRITARAPASLRLRRVSERLAIASAGKAQGACGGCDDCGSEKTSVPAPKAEVSVPVAKIGRRT
jgi:hypothetical protein